MSDLHVGTKHSENTTSVDGGLLQHMRSVYNTMSAGLFITFAAAWAIASLSVTGTASEGATMLREGQYLTGLGEAIFNSPLKWVVIFAPLAYLFFGFGRALHRASASAVQTAFYVFSVLMGLSMSSIFLIYTGTSIVQVFLITSISFAGLSLWGYTTKKNMSGLGTFFMMGLIGLIVAMVVNIFLGSTALQFAISVIGLLLFAGLTAYDTQKIKNLYLENRHSMGSDEVGKLAVMGAMDLYLDFINMFQFLLHFLGETE